MAAENTGLMSRVAWLVVAYFWVFAQRDTNAGNLSRRQFIANEES